jgi:endonuclease YncB( thermonuclease family)
MIMNVVWAILFLLFGSSIVVSQICNSPTSSLRDSGLSQPVSRSGDQKVIKGKVVFVIDGDTITILGEDGIPHPVKLFGIDAPELRQAHGQESADRLGSLVTGKDVDLMVRYIDQKGRYYGDLLLRGEDVGLGQLINGLAWVYLPKRCGDRFDKRSLYLTAESTAKAEKVGLWKDPDPLPPWKFRGEDYDGSSSGSGTGPSRSGANQDLVSSAQPETAAASLKPNAKERQYILGPRGGCYYVNDRHVRVYVGDKTLCGR